MVGFPIIPTSNSSGYLYGQFYFVFEKVNRSLSSILSDNSLDISVNDLGTIACQILEILQYCFSKNKVVKNLGVNDFYLRRTTKGYRVIFLNQDFYSKYLIIVKSFIIIERAISLKIQLLLHYRL